MMRKRDSDSRSRKSDWLNSANDSDWVLRNFRQSGMFRMSRAEKEPTKSISINISTAKHSENNSPNKFSHESSSTEILYDSDFIVGAECLKDDKKLLNRHAITICMRKRAPLTANIRYTRCNHNKKLCNFFPLASSKVQKYNSFFPPRQSLSWRKRIQTLSSLFSHLFLFIYDSEW